MEEAKPLARLLGEFSNVQAPDVFTDLEAFGRAMARERVLQERRTELRDFFGELLDTDFAHPGLALHLASIEKVLAWRYQRRGLLLSGPTGCGKTRALAALGWRLGIEDGIEISLWHAQDLFARITQCQSFGRDEASGFVGALAQRPVLFIDDFGQEAVASPREEHVRAWFFRLLDLRYTHGRPLILSTNHRAQSLAATVRDVRFDPMVRRLVEVAEPVSFWASPNCSK